MSLKATIEHNQSVFIALIVCVIITSGVISCHLTPTEKTEVIAGAAQIATGFVTHTPIPWDKVGLLIGSIIGAGAVIDNRRKDVVIKEEQKHNAVKTAIITNLVNGNSTNSP